MFISHFWNTLRSRGVVVLLAATALLLTLMSAVEHDTTPRCDVDGIMDVYYQDQDPRYDRQVGTSDEIRVMFDAGEQRIPAGCVSALVVSSSDDPLFRVVDISHDWYDSMGAYIGDRPESGKQLAFGVVAGPDKTCGLVLRSASRVDNLTSCELVASKAITIR